MKKERELIAVKDEPSFARCPDSGAIININRNEISLAREAKRRRQMKRKSSADVESKVESLENDMRDIKSLLSQLVEKL